MNNIVIVGLTGNHYSLYIRLAKLIKGKTDYNLNIVVLEKEKKHFEEIKKKYGIRIDIVTDSSVINVLRILRRMNKEDILIMDEYYGAFRKLVNIRLRNRKKILIIHNVNKFLQPKFCLSIRSLLENVTRPLFFNQFDAFITMGPNIKNYLQANKSDKPIFFFPFDQSNKEIDSLKKNESTINIVLPGMISEERRNYKAVLSVLEKYYSDYPNSRIRIRFLGRIVGDNEKFVAIRSDKINQKYNQRIKYWKEFIPTEEFEKEINNADIILSNVRVYNNFKDRIEIYGITKESGVSFIIYKYAKVALVPRIQNILYGFDSQLINFDTYDELYYIFQNIEKNKIDIEQLKKNAIVNRENFNIKIKTENKRLLKYLTKEII